MITTRLTALLRTHRAGVNFNDWMVGGDVLEGNLLANCVREVRQSFNRAATLFFTDMNARVAEW